jgi:predicted dehydrogenase
MDNGEKCSIEAAGSDNLRTDPHHPSRVDGFAMSAPEIGLVVGYGSIGRMHARALDALGATLVLVDGNDEARARAAADHPGARVVADLAALDVTSLPWTATLAAIATWGPSHAEIFNALVDRGVVRILCEKPLATSVADVEAMRARARRDGITLGSHHYFRGSGLIVSLERLATDLALGNPVAIVANGGAACTITNGVHWTDLAAALFHHAPLRVVAQLRDERINPRGAHLGFFGGTAAWDHGDGRELVLHFNNRSSVYPVTHVHYRDAVVTMDYDYEVTVYRRDPTDIARFPAITRTGPARQLAFKGALPGVVDGLTALSAHLERLWVGDDSASPAAAGALAVHAVIGALVAAREGRAIDLPLDPQSAWARESWPIS